MKTSLIAPLLVVLAVLVWPAAADKPPSLISSLLDLLPEFEELSGDSQTGPDTPAVDAQKAEEALEIFSLFTPFIRDVVRGRAESENKPISESTLKSLDTMERLIPKFMNVVLALASRSKTNPNDEPLLDDFTGLVPRGSYGAPRQSRPSESDEAAKLQKEVIGNVLQQSTKLIQQITAARASVRSDSDEAPNTRASAPRPTNYYISSETTKRPKTRRRRPSSQRSYSTTAAPRAESSEELAPVRSYTPRPAYTPTAAPAPPAPRDDSDEKPSQRSYSTTAAPRAESSEELAPVRSYTPRPAYTPTAAPAPPAPRDDSDEKPSQRTYSTSTRVSSGSQPGSSVSFFNLPTARSTRRQRVTRGSDYQVKPQRYFYID